MISHLINSKSRMSKAINPFLWYPKLDIKQVTSVLRRAALTSSRHSHPAIGCPAGFPGKVLDSRGKSNRNKYTSVHARAHTPTEAAAVDSEMKTASMLPTQVSINRPLGMCSSPPVATRSVQKEKFPGSCPLSSNLGGGGFVVSSTWPGKV